jgi:hypothetical protein
MMLRIGADINHTYIENNLTKEKINFLSWYLCPSKNSYKPEIKKMMLEQN